MDEANIIVGGSLSEDAAAFVQAWRRAEVGEAGAARVIAFESWEGLAAVMTGERFRLMRHLHARPEPSISALARSLRRQYRRVHEDVSVLEQAGLLERSNGSVRAAVDKLSAEVIF